MAATNKKGRAQNPRALAFSKGCHVQKTAAKVERHSAEAVALQTMPALGQKRACVPLRMVAEKHDRPAHLPEHSTRASDAFSYVSLGNSIPLSVVFLEFGKLQPTSPVKVRSQILDISLFSGAQGRN